MTADVEAVMSGAAQWTVIHADCRDILALLPEKVCVLVTDPPYGIDLGRAGLTSRGGKHGLALSPYASFDDSYQSFVENIVPALSIALDLCVRGAVFTGPHIHEQRKPDVIGGVYCPAGNGRHVWGFKTFLPVLLYGKAPDLHLGAKVGATIVSTETVDREESDHPVPKPLGWMTWLVGLASRPGDIVLDPFAGSGTTGVAAVRLGRRFIGIEKDAGYAALARERIEAETHGSTLRSSRAGQLPMFGARGNR